MGPKKAEGEKKSLNDQLIDAAKQNDLDLVKELISQGAEASYVCKEDGTWGAYEQYTALHFAITRSKHDSTEEENEKWREMILLLLKNGADPNVTKDSYDWRGCGTRHSAFELLGRYSNESPDPDLLTAFIGAGLNPNSSRTQDIHSMRTDGRIKTYLLHDMTSEGSVDCAIALLDAGADVDARATESICNERGYRQEKSETSLHVAVTRNKVDMCLLLLAKGADINAIEYHFDSQINEDIVAKNEEMCGDDPRDDAYEDPWTITPVGCTPLHLAIEKGQKNINMISVLLACNADPSIRYKKRIEKEEGTEYRRPFKKEKGKGREEEEDEEENASSISSANLFASKENAREASDEALSKPVESALNGALDVVSIIKALPKETQETILKTLDKIKELGWNFSCCNFPVIYEVLKSA